MAWNDAPPTKDELSTAKVQSWSDLPPSIEELKAISKKDVGGSGQTFLESFGNALMLGYAPQAQAAVSTLLNPNAILDAKMSAQGFKINQPSAKEEYLKSRDENISRIAQQEEENPTASTLGTIGGSIVGGLATAPLMPGATVAKSKGLLDLVKAGASTGAKQGAVYGAISNPGDTEKTLAPLQIGERAANAIGGAALGGAIGGAFPVAVQGIKKTIEVAKEVPYALNNYIFGVRPEIAKEYFNFNKRINSSQTVEELKNISDDFVGKLYDDFDKATLNQKEAKEAYKAFESDLVDKYRTAGYEAKEALTSAKQTLDKAHIQAVQNTAQDIVDTVANLQKEVSAGSSKSFEILGRSNVEIPVSPIKAKLTNLINQIKIGGVEAVGSEANSAVKELQAIRDRLDNFKGKLKAEDVKQLIQQVQRSAEYGQLPGQYNSQQGEALKTLAATINRNLKGKIPAYDAAMESVAGNTKLLSMVQDFGDPFKTAQVLKNIESLSSGEKRKAIDALGKKYGLNFLEKVNPKNLAEYTALLKAQREVDALRPDFIRKNIDQTLESSKVKQNLLGAEQNLAQKEEAFLPFKPLAPNIAGQTTAEQKLTQLGKYNAPIELKEMFAKLSKLSGTDFERAMKDQEILKTFERSSMNGSRNSVFGAVLGLMTGGGFIGAGAGVSFGRLLDTKGPAMSKKIIDAAIKVSEKPSVKTVVGLEIPQEIKNNLIQAIRSGSIYNYSNAPLTQNGSMNRKLESMKGKK
mgnify:CR=1 FL=1